MQLPTPFRAAVGLVVTTAEEARHLPDRAIELPMLAVSSVLQASLRAQQRYARLAARGDEVLNHREPTPEPPAWATFDEPVDVPPLAAVPDEFTVELSVVEAATDESHTGAPGAAMPAPRVAAKKALAKKAAAKTAAASAASTKASPRKASARKPGTKSTAARAAGTKSVSKPRHTAPSPFDDVVDPD